MSEEMTDKQIENWRKILVVTLGPYAMLMPKEEIVAIRDTMQGQCNPPE